MQLYNKIKIHETQIAVKAKNKQFLKGQPYLFTDRASIVTPHSSGVPFLKISATLHNRMHTQL